MTLDNWQTASQIGWTFCHIAEILPTALISRGSRPAAPLLRRIEPVAELGCRAADGHLSSVGKIMDSTNTDGWMVLHGDRILAEEYPGEMEPATLHLLMSVSKSIVGILAGALVDRGVLDVEEQVIAYVPELEQSGYARRYSPPVARHAFRHSPSRRNISIPMPRCEYSSRRSAGHLGAHQMCHTPCVNSC